MKNYQIQKYFPCISPPADVEAKLNSIRDDYRAKTKELNEKRWQELKAALKPLAQHADVLPVGTKFMYWHRIKSKRVELEITQVTVRPIFDSWDLVYICQGADGKQVNVEAGSMKEVESC